MISVRKVRWRIRRMIRQCKLLCGWLLLVFFFMLIAWLLCEIISKIPDL